jgi:uncharacterized protein
LLHHGDVFKTLPTGESLRGYIKQIRPDGRIDLCLTPPKGDQGKDLQSQILAHVAALGGNAPIGDKTAPEEIYQLFQTSKKNFKRALSTLYRDRKIVLREDGIGLPPTKNPWRNTKQ